MCMVKVRLLDTDENYSLRGEILSNQIKKDIDEGFIPFFVNKHKTINFTLKKRAFFSNQDLWNARYNIVLFL